VRIAGAGHGPANAIMLPHTLGALAWRFPAWIGRLGEAIGGDPSEIAAALCARTGATRLAELGVVAAALDECADAAAGRPELDLTAPRADRAELRALYGDAL
jgi:alcohol dehydrogenase class IV